MEQRMRTAAAALSVVLLSTVSLVARRVDSPASDRERELAIVITFLGTGNPRPTPTRFGPSILVEAGTERLLVDAGRGCTIRLFEAGSASLVSGITAVLLTHLHSDHVVGLPDLWLTGWMFGRRSPLEVFGPPGTIELAAGLERAYAFDVRMRRDVDERLPAAGVELPSRDIDPGFVFERGGVKVTAFAVDHSPVVPAYGYRVDYAGRSVVFSGDTRYSPSLIAASAGADVVVHEVVSPDVERRRARVRDPAAVERIIAHHTTPEDAGRVFTAINPRLAVYSHIVPSPATAKDLVGPTRRTWSGRLEVAYDLMEIRVGSRVEVRRRPRVPE
jgi:ribonuclease Z